MIFDNESLSGKSDILGWHWMVDFFQCVQLPTDPFILETILVTAAEMAGATVVQSCFHRFSPHGLSGVVVIAESHLAAHTWPEHHALCLDIFSCSPKIHAQTAIDYVAEKIQARKIAQRHVSRGNLLD
ncbi:MAG TPA: adenosylmethionine decarboxylase [Pirellula sp.]|nr:adenosylmethionine decarboxylase [Pirellula sp.]